jgi:hypothetical protein
VDARGEVDQLFWSAGRGSDFTNFGGHIHRVQLWANLPAAREMTAESEDAGDGTKNRR